jgi:hypothetical protein
MFMSEGVLSHLRDISLSLEESYGFVPPLKYPKRHETIENVEVRVRMFSKWVLSDFSYLLGI